MSRVYCQQCHRPEKACICAFSVHINNHIHVVILQHPSEIKQSKGTVSLLHQSLMHCEVIVGENFTDNNIFTTLLSYYGDNIALLFPSEDAIEINFSSHNRASITAETCDNKHIECIIILDGTWKKAYKMFMVNPCLHKVKHLVLPEGIESLYHIRKTKKNNALSSLEACCYALARLEDNEKKYQPMLEGFIKFNQFQHSFSQ